MDNYTDQDFYYPNPTDNQIGQNCNANNSQIPSQQYSNNYFVQSTYQIEECECQKPADHLSKKQNPQYRNFLCHACVERKNLGKQYVPIRDYENFYLSQYSEQNKNLIALNKKVQEMVNTGKNYSLVVEECKNLSSEYWIREQEIYSLLQIIRKGYVSLKMYNQLQTYLSESRLNQQAEALFKSLKEFDQLQTIKLSAINVKMFGEQFDIIFNRINLNNYLMESDIFQNVMVGKIAPSIENFIFNEIPLVAKIIGQQSQVINDDKKIYNGFLDADKKHGCGIYILRDRKIFYCGVFDNDEFFWGVKLVAVSNHQYQMYKGYFQNFEITGDGELQALDEKHEHKYKGKFLKGLRHGYGKYTWLTDNETVNSEYDGQWKFNKQHGEGSHTSKSEKRKLVGKFENGLPVDVKIYELDTNKFIKDFKVQENQPKPIVPSQNLPFATNNLALQPASRQPVTQNSLTQKVNTYSQPNSQQPQLNTAESKGQIIQQTTSANPQFPINPNQINKFNSQPQMKTMQQFQGPQRTPTQFPQQNQAIPQTKLQQQNQAIPQTTTQLQLQSQTITQATQFQQQSQTITQTPELQQQSQTTPRTKGPQQAQNK